MSFIVEYFLIHRCPIYRAPQLGESFTQLIFSAYDLLTNAEREPKYKRYRAEFPSLNLISNIKYSLFKKTKDFTVYPCLSVSIIPVISIVANNVTSISRTFDSSVFDRAWFCSASRYGNINIIQTILNKVKIKKDD